jgi:plastocyanin
MLKRFASGLSLAVVAASLTSFAQAADWADLKIKVIYDAKEAPELVKLQQNKDPLCPAEVPSHHLVVNPDNMGIKSLIVYADSRKSKFAKDEINTEANKPSAEPVVLDNVECVFEPHVLLARPGDTVSVKNSDKTGHNANFTFLNNPSQNFLIPAGGSKDMKLELAERLPMKVECNVHPWMNAIVVCLDHPYSAASDENGEMTIAKLPVGKEVTFKLWHENMDKSFESAEINGEIVELKRGTFVFTVPEDGAELVVKLAPEGFKPFE